MLTDNTKDKFISTMNKILLQLKLIYVSKQSTIEISKLRQPAKNLSSVFMDVSWAGELKFKVIYSINYI